MKIAIDARELCGKPTGVGRYLSELLAEWSAGPEHERHQWRLYAHDRPTIPLPFRDRVTILPGAGGTRWEQWDFARRLTVDRPDVLFAPAYTAPLTAPCPVVLTIHDVSFFDHREEFGWREGLRRRRITAWAARRARLVLTVSEFSRGRIMERIGIPASRVRVIHHGMRHSPATQAPAAAREPIVLYVGSIFPRRHVDVLVDTFGRLVAPRVPDARLEVIGEQRLPPGQSTAGWLQDLPVDVRDRITFRSWVDEETLAGLYGRARAFAFLSDYEGFGLTPLEALAAGIPPVVLDTPVAREIYGPAAHYVSDRGLTPGDRGLTPGDLDQIASTDLRTVENSARLAEALIDLLTDEHKRADILRHAPDVLARYDWARAAGQTLSALVEAAGA